MRKVPADAELARIAHDIGRLGLDARRELIMRRQAAADAQARLFDLEMLAMNLRSSIRSALRPKFQVPEEVQFLRTSMMLQREAKLAEGD